MSNETIDLADYARGKKKFPSAELERINFRLPDGLREKIKESAKANKRSMNSELIARLEASFEPSKQIAPAIAELLENYIQDEVGARLKAIAAKIGGSDA